MIPITAAAVLIGISAAYFWTQTRDANATRINPEQNVTLEARRESHQQMLKRLRQLREQSAEQSKLVGKVPLPEMRNLLAQEEISPSGWERHMAFSNYLLIRGDEARAIRGYRHALNVGRQIEKQMPGAAHEALFALAVGYLRLGETENCCAQNQPASCIFPIRESAIHDKETGSREAIRALLAILQLSRPESDTHQSARWLLNIAYMTLGEHPEKVPPKYLMTSERFQSDEEFPSFPNIAKSAGLNTFGLSGGAVTDDFDRDGDVDLLVSDWHADGQMRYFVNNGKGGFEDRTHQAGLIGLYGGLNMVQADYNNDGYIDVFVLRGAWLGENGKQPNSLLRNNGNGTFTDVTMMSG